MFVQKPIAQTRSKKRKFSQSKVAKGCCTNSANSANSANSTIINKKCWNHENLVTRQFEFFPQTIQGKTMYKQK